MPTIVIPPIKKGMLILFQQLLSFHAVQDLYAKEAMNVQGRRKFVYNVYHGIDGDKNFVSLVEMLCKSQQRFKPLFDDAGLAKQCFGPISNTPLASLGIEGAHLHKAVLSESRRRTGETILNCGKAALKAMKKYHALWKQCQYSDGRFQSGKTEETALLFVRQQVFKEGNTVLDADEGEEEEEEQEEKEEEDDDGNDTNSKPMPADYYPLYWAVFVLYGPFCKTFNMEPSALLAVDSSWLDEHKGSRTKARAQVKKEKDIERQITNDRGAPSAARKQELIDMAVTITMQNQATLAKIREQIQTCKMMIECAETEAETKHWKKQLRKYASELCSDNCFVLVTSDIPPLLPQTAISTTTSTSSTFQTPLREGGDGIRDDSDDNEESNDDDNSDDDDDTKATYTASNREKRQRLL